MKILLLCPFYPPNIGGAETFAEGLAEYLAKDNFVRVLAYQPFNKKVLNTPGNPGVYRMSWPLPMGKAWKGQGFLNFLRITPKMLFASIKHYRDFKPDIVFCNGLNAAFIGAILNVLFKVRVRTILLALYGFTRSGSVISDVSALIFNRMEKIYVEGAGGYRDIAPLAVDRKKVVKFQHWCNQRIFKPKKHYYKKMKVLFVGRPISEKGIDIVKACEKELKGQVDFEYITDVPYKDLPKYYQMADVCVVPSRYDEGISRVVIESASCGCAVITSDRGSLPEVTGGFGLTFPTESYHLLLFLISYFDNDRKILQIHRRLAYEHAKKYFSQKNAEVFSQ